MVRVWFRVRIRVRVRVRVREFLAYKDDTSRLTHADKSDFIPLDVSDLFHISAMPYLNVFPGRKMLEN